MLASKVQLCSWNIDIFPFEQMIILHNNSCQVYAPSMSTWFSSRLHIHSKNQLHSSIERHSRDSDTLGHCNVGFFWLHNADLFKNIFEYILDLKWISIEYLYTDSNDKRCYHNVFYFHLSVEVLIKHLENRLFEKRLWHWWIIISWSKHLRLFLPSCLGEANSRKME